MYPALMIYMYIMFNIINHVHNEYLIASISCPLVLLGILFNIYRINFP